MALTTDEMNTIIKKVVKLYSQVAPRRLNTYCSIRKGVHRVEDTANDETTANASDATTLYALLNALKTKYTAHIASTTYHRAADATNSIAAADATDEGSAVTLANELKDDLNLHMVQSGVHYSDDTANRVTTEDAIDSASAITLANDVKATYNDHMGEELDGRWLYIKDIVDAAG